MKVLKANCLPHAIQLNLSQQSNINIIVFNIQVSDVEGLKAKIQFSFNWSCNPVRTSLLCKVLTFYPCPSSAATIGSSWVKLCKYAACWFAQGCKCWFALGCRSCGWKFLSSRVAEVGMTAAIADTLPPCWSTMNHCIAGWPHSCQQSVAGVAPPIIVTPPHCAEESQTCGTLLIQNLAPPAVNRTLDMAFIQNLWHPFGVNSLAKHLYQTSWYHSAAAEKYPRGRNWMQRRRGDYSNEQTGNEAREAACQNCVKWTKTLFCCRIWIIYQVESIWVGPSR